MDFDPQCISCIVQQVYNSAMLFTDGDKELQLEIMKDVCRAVETVNINYTAPRFSSIIQSIVENHLGIINPYERIKESNRAKAERYLPFLRTLIDGADDKLDIAIRSAIIGNIIDLGASPHFDIETEINRMTSHTLDLSILPRFKRDVLKARVILYVGDNYEEALFDRLLIQELQPKKIVFAVRSRAVLNDITLDDAGRIGLDSLCNVIESGSTIAGTDLPQCTTEFLELYKNADMVIAKGQGNYETLCDETRPIYFLFKVKCDVIARRSGYPIGTGILMSNQWAKS